MEVVRPSGQRFIRWHRDNDTLLRSAERFSTEGANVYFSFSTYREEDTRSLQNLDLVGAFALDIDVRESGGQYDSFEKAAPALGAAIKASGLPYPFINHSGGGIHVFWPVVGGVALSKWRPIQRALLKRLSDNGLKVDVGPSMNAVGLFRVPGTLNHKRGADVLVLHEGTAVDAEEIATLLGVEETEESATPALRLPPGFRLIDSLKKLRGTHVFSEKTLEPILSQCAQMRAAPAGQEPFWRAGLAIVRLVRDAKLKAHVWSALCPEIYSAEAVDA
jgi:hypothetical protein